MDTDTPHAPLSLEPRVPDGHVVVITGATAGVGRATARRFARDGARIALLARGEEGLEATAREVEELGGAAIPIPTDVGDPDAVVWACELIEKDVGPIDVWINNAMTTVFGRASDVSPAEWRRVTEVTYLGYVWGTLAALRGMRARDRGTIVQVGSALAYRSIPLQAPYCAAKHAIRGFTDSLRSELLHDGVDVHLTMVQLPALNTPQFDWCLNKMSRRPQPVPPIYQPELAAEAIHWAAHHRRREIYVAGPTIQAILGNKIAPGVLDHYLASRAWTGQLTDEEVVPDARSNLFEAVPGDHGAHGRFDARAGDGGAVARASIVLGAAGVRVVAAALVTAGVLGAVRLLRR